MKQGPTPEMIRTVEYAKERVKHIKEVDYNEHMAKYRKKEAGQGSRSSTS